jgi:hypothetical protein
MALLRRDSEECTMLHPLRIAPCRSTTSPIAGLQQQASLLKVSAITNVEIT